jgi:hypothetical protein
MTGYVRNVLAAVTVAALLAATSTMVGCGKGGGDANNNPKVTKENGEKVKLGMSEKEVADILGQHADTNTPPNLPGVKGLIYKNGNNIISVMFNKEGKVENVLKQFVN